MKSPVVMIGVGEMGGVFARGLLRAGIPVIPVTREVPMRDLAAELPDPAMVLVAVAEGDLHPVLDDLPEAWKGRVGLLQNELLPRDWERHGLSDPTVISVWFEKKPGKDFKVIIPSPAHGPGARLLHDGLATLGIPVRVLADPDQLVFELVVKNLYILTTNIAGLVAGGTVGELWDGQRDLAESVADDVIAIQAGLTGRAFDRKALTDAMLTAFRGDPDHGCMGRSAPARLARARATAEELGIRVPALDAIAARG